MRSKPRGKNRMVGEYVIEDRGFATPCWVWQRFKNHGGYGMKHVGGRAGRAMLAHRWFFEAKCGPIPPEMVIDHLCRVRACVNPDHLEVVTRKENILRGEGRGAKAARRGSCLRGHPLEGENVYIHPNGSRRCRACRRAWDEARRAA